MFAQYSPPRNRRLVTANAHPEVHPYLWWVLSNMAREAKGTSPKSVLPFQGNWFYGERVPRVALALLAYPGLDCAAPLGR